MAVVAPFLALIWAIRFYFVDVPFIDEWDLVPLVGKSFLGQLSFSDFWAQHNEHRILFPNLIILALVRLSSWNQMYEVLVNILLAVGCFALLIGQMNKTESFIGDYGMGWMALATSLIVFSLRQWENWVMGVNMVIFLSVFAAMSGIIALSSHALNWKGFLVAALLGMVSTYSFSSGLVFWPAGIFLLCFTPAEKGFSRRLALLLWLAISSLAIFAYFSGDYAKPSQHPAFLYGAVHPAEFLKYFFMYLGSLIIEDPCAWEIGLLGFMGFCGMGLFLGLHPKTRKEWFLVYMGLGLFAIGNAFVTAVGRTGFHSYQALSSRYVTISYPFWISVLVLFILSVGMLWNGQAARCSGAVLCLLLVFSLARTSLTSLQHLQDHRRLLERAREELFVLKDDAILATIYPDPDVLRQRASILRARKLSIFRGRETH